MPPLPRVSRDAVLQAAELLLEREGPAALSVRRLADHLGVSRQIVYSRFEDKADLVRALHAEGFRRLTDRLTAVTGPARSRERVRLMALAYRDAALASPALYGLMFGRPVLEFTPDARAREVAEAAFAPLLEAVRDWLRSRGPVRGRRALDAATAVWAGTHGVVSLELGGLVGGEAPRLVDRLVAAALADDVASRA